MAVTARHRASHSHEEESYFISMTDMMIGMLFLFIIMLMFFAMKFNEAAEIQTAAVETILSSDETRSEILKGIERSMQEHGVQVAIDLENGILRLPESILFDSGKAELTSRGKTALISLAKALGTVLPCHASLPDRPRPDTCLDSPHTVEAVFVEGHTDSDGEDVLNWNLSMRRSLNTYLALIEVNPDLHLLMNRSSQAVMSISGYGKQRPVTSNDTEENKRLNRRIDLRFIMATPKVEQIDRIGSQVRERMK